MAKITKALLKNHQNYDKKHQSKLNSYGWKKSLQLFN